MADIFERLIKNYGPLGQHRERAHGYFAFPKLEGEISNRMIFRGKEKKDSSEKKQKDSVSQEKNREKKVDEADVSLCCQKNSRRCRMLSFLG